MTKIEKYFEDIKFVKDVIVDKEQYIIYENEEYYEIYVYGQMKLGKYPFKELYPFDPTVFDILNEHYVISKKLFKLN